MKALKIIGATLFVVVLLALGVVAYVKFALPDVGPPPELTVEPTPERLARGEHLVNDVMACLDCHAKRDFSLSMAPVIAGSSGGGGEKWGHEFNFPGELYAPNITPHALKDWTDGEIYRAITMGVDKDGNALFPIMPYLNYGRLPDEDIYAVIAYIRTLPEIETEFPEPELDFPLSLLVNTIPRKAEEKLEMPDPDDKLAYGRYLFTAAACNECHTRQENGEFVMEEFAAGGFDFQLPNGIVVTSANITPHPEHGIGTWNSDQFLARFQAYRDSLFVPRPVADGEFNTVMPWLIFSRMEDEELEAIFTYLQSLKPVDKEVEKFRQLPLAAN